MEILTTILEYLPMVLVLAIFVVAAVLFVKGEKGKIKNWLIF